MRRTFGALHPAPYEPPRTHVTKPARKVEVPGEAAASPPSVAPDPATDHLRAAELEQRVEATKDLVGSSEALDWGHLTTPSQILNKISHNPDDDLPQPEDIDWSQQKGNAVLTRQGWLLKA
jgi:hypothetical protein